MELFDKDGNPVTAEQINEAMALVATEQITVHVLNRDGIVISRHTFDTPLGGRRIEVVWPEGNLTYAPRVTG
jgi:hypothetical protein